MRFSVISTTESMELRRISFPTAWAIVVCTGKLWKWGSAPIDRFTIAWLHQKASQVEWKDELSFCDIHIFRQFKIYQSLISKKYIHSRNPNSRGFSPNHPNMKHLRSRALGWNQHHWNALLSTGRDGSVIWKVHSHAELLKMLSAVWVHDDFKLLLR